jgi:arginyl-tRNA--protein-N-Asp/Glu arginylyltransferase
MQEATTIDYDGLGSVDCFKLYGYNWDKCGYCRGGRRASSNGASQQQLQLQNQETGEVDDNSHSAGAISRNNTHRGGGSNNKDTYRSYLTKLDSPLRPASYEALMCRGWRRSGTIVYKPDNAVTCCPQHTIRLPVADYVPNKEQKKVLRKMQSLLGQDEEKEERSSNGGGSNNGNHNNARPKKHLLKDAVMAFLARNGVIASLARETETHLTHLLQERDCKKLTIPPVRYKLHGLTNGSSATSIAATLSCPICTTLVAQKVIEKRAASDLASRLVQRMQELSPVLSSSDIVVVVSSMTFTTAGILRVEVQVPNEALADHRSTSTTTNNNNGRQRAVDPLAAWFQAKGLPVPTDRSMRIHTLPATESAATDPRVHQLYWDYQEAVHGDTHPLKSNHAVATSSPSSTTSATTTIQTNEYHHSGTRGASSTFVDVRALPMLEKTYGGSSSPSSSLAGGAPVPWQAFAAFWDFLVHSPLGTSTVHQLYTIGDALVAVGVLDILPTGVSSVYCFYDPTFSKLVPLGTYTAVREIEYTRSLQRSYYYLGYYIESNPKMNYKGDYIGSQVRCTATGEWVGVDDARKVLRRDERARFGTGTTSNNSHPTAMVDVGSLPILTNQGIIYGNILQDEDKEYFFPFLEEWVSLVGPDVALTGTVDIRE